MYYAAGHPLRDARLLLELIRIYREERPDIVHHVSLKPVVLGSIAVATAGTPLVVNAITGLGYMFASTRAHARLLRGLATPLLRSALRRRNSVTIVQNPDDATLLDSLRMVRPERLVLIPGSGVDVAHFKPSQEPDSPPIVLMACRVLWDKGVGEFVEAARELSPRSDRPRFVLVGPVDIDNPSAVPAETIRQWAAEGAIEWWGSQPDLASVLPRASIVVLPSYREGLPKVLAEAASCARAVVTTDVPGCRQVVREGENGLLVPPRDPRALAGAIARLLDDGPLRTRMGAAGRRLAETELGVARIVDQTLAVYGTQGD